MARDGGYTKENAIAYSDMMCARPGWHYSVYGDKEYVDHVAGEIRRIWDLMNTSYDKFIRTTDQDHEAQVQKIFKKLYDQGDIYKGYYEGLYCTPCESFFTESQLVNGKCPDCGGQVKPAREEAYFFKMSKYAQRLIDHINAHPEFIQPVSRKMR